VTQDPNKLAVEWKARDFAFNQIAAAGLIGNVTITGLTLQGSTFHLPKCYQCSLVDLVLEHVFAFSSTHIWLQ
jgi:hypothetical protein